MFIRPVSSIEVRETIDKFKIKATLDSKIRPLKIANGCDKFTDALTKAVNSSFEQGTFPNALKIARVVPVHKGGSKTEACN